MKSFIIVLPRGATGGCELGHQLVHSINRNTCHKAFVMYYPFSDNQIIPEQYEKYDCETISFDAAADLSNKKIILPEIFTYLVRNFHNSDVAIWWMSVDNYFGSKKLRFALANKFIPLTYCRRFGKNSKIVSNLYQSEYARLFLEGLGVSNSMPLSDFLNPSFLKEASVQSEQRENIVLFNPAKGANLTRKIRDHAPEITFIPIVNLTRDEVSKLLKRAKIYIDFGHHPGKDRIPREAAISGCCILVGRRGSAANNVDIPIPDEFKFSVKSSFDPSAVTHKIFEIFREFPAYSLKYLDYREKIFREEEMFVKDTRKLTESF